MQKGSLWFLFCAIVAAFAVASNAYFWATQGGPTAWRIMMIALVGATSIFFAVKYAKSRS